MNRRTSISGNLYSVLDVKSITYFTFWNSMITCFGEFTPELHGTPIEPVISATLALRDPREGAQLQVYSDHA